MSVGRDRLDEEIEAIFGENEKTEEGNEKSIGYREYIDKINERAMKQRKKRKEERKKYWQNYHGQRNNEENSRM